MTSLPSWRCWPVSMAVWCRPDAAFQGFAHPAVITVAAVLIISRTLQNSGLVDYLVRFLAPTRRTTTLQVAAGSALGGISVVPS